MKPNSHDVCIVFQGLTLSERKTEYYDTIKCLVGEGERMSPLHRDIMQENRSYLVQNLDMTGLLLDHLHAKEVISRNQLDKIRAANVLERKGLLLDIIDKQADTAFYNFIDALQKSNQPHLAERLREGSGEHLTKRLKVLMKDFKKSDVTLNSTMKTLFKDIPLKRHKLD